MRNWLRKRKEKNDDGDQSSRTMLIRERSLFLWTVAVQPALNEQRTGVPG